MNLKKYLNENTIKLDLDSQTAEEVLNELTDMLCHAGLLKPACRDKAISALKRREKMMSTGLQDGVAIPHAKTEGVDDLVCALGIKRQGIDFNALDGKKSQIFVITLSPKGVSVPHVPFLAEVCKILHVPEVRDAMLRADDPADILKHFSR